MNAFFIPLDFVSVELFPTARTPEQFALGLSTSTTIPLIVQKAGSRSICVSDHNCGHAEICGIKRDFMYILAALGRMLFQNSKTIFT